MQKPASISSAMEEKRTIEKILNIKTGEVWDADYIFRDEEARESEIFRLRNEIEQHIQQDDIEYVCRYCKQAIALRGKNARHRNYKRYYFTHLKQSEDCIIKTVHRFTEAEVRCIKYNGERESPLHIELKNQIGYHLGQDSQFSDVKIDKVYINKAISTKWRKPDIFTRFGEKQIAFELQLSTTFLSVIVGRTLFYKAQRVFLVWIFPGFSVESDLQKFTEKDVYYNNNFNVYVFDKEAHEKSKEANTLVLKCFYKRFYINYDEVDNQWTSDFLQINDLKFNHSNTEAHYYDSDAELESKKAELEIIQEERKKEKAREWLRSTVKKPLEQIERLYKTDEHIIAHQLKSQMQSMSDEQKAALSEAIDLSLGKETVLSSLFFERSKPNFLEFVRGQECVTIDAVKFDGILDEIMLMDNMRAFRFYLSSLFMLGYTCSDKDKGLLASLFRENRSRQTDAQCEMLEKCAYATFVSRLKTRKAIEEVVNVLHVIYAVASLKAGVIIGSRLNNLRQVTNNFLQNQYNYGDIYLKAMDVYKKRDEILREDKTGKIRKKIENYISQGNRQETAYNSIINTIFPELELTVNSNY